MELLSIIYLLLKCRNKRFTLGASFRFQPDVRIFTHTYALCICHLEKCVMKKISSTQFIENVKKNINCRQFARCVRSLFGPFEFYVCYKTLYFRLSTYFRMKGTAFGGFCAKFSCRLLLVSGWSGWRRNSRIPMMRRKKTPKILYYVHNYIYHTYVYVVTHIQNTLRA